MMAFLGFRLNGFVLMSCLGVLCWDTSKSFRIQDSTQHNEQADVPIYLYIYPSIHPSVYLIEIACLTCCIYCIYVRYIHIWCYGSFILIDNLVNLYNLSSLSSEMSYPVWSYPVPSNIIQFHLILYTVVQFTSIYPKRGYLPICLFATVCLSFLPVATASCDDSKLGRGKHAGPHGKPLAFRVLVLWTSTSGINWHNTYTVMCVCVCVFCGCICIWLCQYIYLENIIYACVCSACITVSKKNLNLEFVPERSRRSKQIVEVGRTMGWQLSSIVENSYNNRR